MNQVIITGPDNLVEAEITPKKETYYLVTEDTLRSISGKSVLTDIFAFVASLLWGAYFSVLISTKASTGLAEITLNTLAVYKKVFLVSSIVLSLLAALFLWITHKAIRRIRKSTLPK